MSKLIYKPVATESPTSFSDDNTQSFAELRQLTPIPQDPQDNYHHRQTRNKPSTKRRKKIRRWREFPGRNSFFCDGRVMTSHERGVFYLTCILISTTSILFFVFDCPYLATQISVLIPLTGGLLFILVMSLLIRTSSMDPGVIPRASQQEASYLEKQIEVIENGGGDQTYKPPPRTRDLIIRGRSVTIKYCFTCKIFRPPRASHCSICDNCVERFDHHCPWVGNCVGARNYRYFYLFLLSLSLLSSFIFSTCLLHMYSLSKTDGVFVGLKKSPASLVELLVCFLSMWSVIGLTAFHTYLILTNTTTNEDMKGLYSVSGSSTSLNPYREDNACVNLCSVVCGPQVPSLINRRALVQSETSNLVAMATSPTITTVANGDGFSGGGTDHFKVDIVRCDDATIGSLSADGGGLRRDFGESVSLGPGVSSYSVGDMFNSNNLEDQDNNARNDSNVNICQNFNVK